MDSSLAPIAAARSRAESGKTDRKNARTIRS